MTWCWSTCGCRAGDGVSLLVHVRQTYPRIESIGMSAADDAELVTPRSAPVPSATC
jgi:hypothetical protein